MSDMDPKKGDRMKLQRVLCWLSERRGVAGLLVVLLPLLVVMAVGAPSAKEGAADSAESQVQVAPVDTIPPDLVRAREILGQMEATLDSIQTLEERMTGKTESQKAIIRVQGRQQFIILNDLQPDLLKLIPKLNEAGVPIDDLMSGFQVVVTTSMDYYILALDSWNKEIDRLRKQRATVSAEDVDELETEIGEARVKLDNIYELQMHTLTAGDSLRLETGEEWENLERALKERAETLVGRLQIAVKARDKLEEKIKDEQRAGATEAEIGPDRIRLQLAKRRVAGIAKSLETTTDLLGQRGFETTQYRQFAIQTTGEITKRILDPKVFIGLVTDGVGNLWGWFKDAGPILFVKLLILIIFVIVFRLAFMLAWWILRFVRVIRVSRLMADIVGRMLNPVATTLGILTGLWFVGVNPTTLLAGVGVLGVVVGLALQDSLANLAAGFFILVTQPFDVDDTVVGGGVLGTVKTMGLANTTIVTFDGRRVMVPNRKVWGENIENRSAEFIRRAEITVKISYDEDIDKALEIIRDLMASEERVLESPEPLIFVSNLADSWVEIAVRPWTANKDWWPLLTDLPRLVRNRFAERGIEIPVPRRDVSIGQDGKNAHDDAGKTTK